MGRDEKCSLCSGYKVYKKVFSAREAWHSPKNVTHYVPRSGCSFYNLTPPPYTHTHTHTHTSKGLPLSAIGVGLLRISVDLNPGNLHQHLDFFYCNKRLDFNHYCNNKTLAYYLL